jgi:hypothetical protein
MEITDKNPLSIIDFSNILTNDMEIRDLNIHFLIIIGKYLNVVLEEGENFLRINGGGEGGKKGMS